MYVCKHTKKTLVYMHIDTCICVYICTYLFIYIYTCICTCILYLPICIYTKTNTTHQHMYAEICMISRYMYVYIYICTYTCGAASTLGPAVCWAMFTPCVLLRMLKLCRHPLDHDLDSAAATMCLANAWHRSTQGSQVSACWCL